MVYDFDFLRVEGGYSLDIYSGKNSCVVIPESYLNKPVVRIEADFSSARKLDNFDFEVGIMVDFFSHIPITNAYIIEIFVPSSVQTICKGAFSSCPNLVKISAVSPIANLHRQAFSYTHNLVDVSFYFWGCFSVFELAKFAVFKFEHWDDVPFAEQDLILAFVKRRKPLIELIFTSGSSVSIALLISLNIKITLEQIDVYLQHSINAQSTAVTAIFLEYKNMNFSQKQIDKFEENKDLVAFGLAFPTLKQLKKNWDISFVGDDIFITGYKGQKLKEVVPEFTFEGHRIVGFLNREKSFSPIQELTILAKIEGLEDNIFQFFTTLKYISLPSSLKFIKKSAFSYCRNLVEIVIPENVAFIEERAFFNCTSLSLVEFNCEVEFEDSVFSDCPKLKIIRNY